MAATRARTLTRQAVILALLLGSVGGPLSAQPLPRRATPAEARTGPTRVWIRNVVMYPLDDAPAQVVELSGSLQPTRAGALPVFDDVGSYGVRVEHAVVRLGPASMTALMNRHILPASDGPIKKVSVSFAPGQILMRGTMVKAGVPVPFTATATAKPNTQGDMEIAVVKMKAAGIVPKRLMDALGLTMSKVAQPKNREVFHIVGDTMVMPVVSMFPPPKFSGRLRSVRITPEAMIAEIGAPSPTAAPFDAPSFIHYRAGSVGFARRLVMRDVDMTVLPKDGGALGFSPKNYYAQMERGFTVSRPDFGMTSRYLSYEKLKPASKGG